MGVSWGQVGQEEQEKAGGRRSSILTLIHKIITLKHITLHAMQKLITRACREIAQRQNTCVASMRTWVSPQNMLSQSRYGSMRNCDGEAGTVLGAH